MTGMFCDHIKTKKLKGSKSPASAKVPLTSLKQKLELQKVTVVIGGFTQSNLFCSA
jgi:hypothetical protein